MTKKILLTGASGGFGFLSAMALAENGYQVAGTMRSTSGKNAQVAAKLQTAGVHLVEMDVTDEASVNAGVSEAARLLGGLDVIVNNAGLGAMGLQELFTAEDLQRVFDVNVFGVHRVMRAVLPIFREQGSGTIVHISSCIGRLAFPFYGPYCASKWALEALAENYRTELSGFGIESCIIEPGGMPTAFLDAMMRPGDQARAPEYGPLAEVPEAALQGFEAALLANPAQRPEKVAAALVELLDLPFGEKPFRKVVDFMGLSEPVQEYNEKLHAITRGVLTNFGSEEMLALGR